MTTLSTVTSYTQLVLLLENVENPVQFLQAEGLLSSSRVCYRRHCRKQMVLRRDTKAKFKLVWRCYKCSRGVPVATDTYFSSMKFDWKQVILAMFLWAAETTAQSAATLLGLRAGAVHQLYEYSRDIVSYKLVKHPEHFVFAGPGKRVQIDEAVFAPRKYNVGRVNSGSKKWVFGIYDEESRRSYLEIIPDKTKQTLLPIIQAHVKPGSTIWSDCWSSYQGLENIADYEHGTVNHSKNFKDPVTGTVLCVVRPGARQTHLTFPYVNRRVH